MASATPLRAVGVCTARLQQPSLTVIQPGGGNLVGDGWENVLSLRRGKKMCCIPYPSCVAFGAMIRTMLVHNSLCTSEPSCHGTSRVSSAQRIYKGRMDSEGLKQKSAGQRR